MLQILGRPNSINVRKVLWTCIELDLAHELEPWGAGVRSTDTPEFRALNPNAMVPVLRDGAFVLWESNAICRYLANAHPQAGGASLLPPQPQARAHVEQWMDWQATELNGAWRYAYLALVRGSAENEPAAIAVSVRAWNRQMALLEAQLERTGAFVAGAAFTLADVVLGLSLNRWHLTPIEQTGVARPTLPALAAYHARLAERTGFRQHGANGMP